MDTPINVPAHIAFIPDGNRRWARGQGLAPHKGHEQGAANFREAMRTVFRLGATHATFWAASEDNLRKRTTLEVSFLADLLRRELASKEFEAELAEHEIRLRFIGRWNDILHDAGLAAAVSGAEERTAQFSKRHLTILFGYDGQQEMLAAIQQLQTSDGSEVTAETVQRALWTGVLPPVDLVVRTGEEEPGWSHWSAGFLMWQAANAVIYSTPTFWPAFSKDELERVFAAFATRERRFGK